MIAAMRSRLAFIVAAVGALAGCSGSDKLPPPSGVQPLTPDDASASETVPREASVRDASDGGADRAVTDHGAEVEVVTVLEGGETVIVHPGDALPEGQEVEPAPAAK